MTPLTTPGVMLTPALRASRQQALGRGIAAAMERHSGLLLYTGIPGFWICAYPPAGLSVDGAAEWARVNGILLRPGDSYWSAAEVVAASGM